MPEKCPFCQGKVAKKKGEVAYCCLNKNCFEIQKQKIKHFVSKKGFDIEGLGEKIVQQLINEGLIKDAADIFTLTKGDLEPLERFAQKSADNLIHAIQASKKIDLPRFIQAIGIRHVGEQSAFDLARHFKTLDNLMRADEKTLMALPDLGPVVSKSIIVWFKDKKNQELLRKLKNQGIVVTNFLNKKEKKVFQNKKFVFTGALKSMARDHAKKTIQELGGKVLTQISHEVDFLVVGEKPGSKYEKAKKLGVKIISEKDFLNMMK